MTNKVYVYCSLYYVHPNKSYFTLIFQPAILLYYIGHEIIAYTPYEEQDIVKWKSLAIKC